jgi:hypothetical protein
VATSDEEGGAGTKREHTPKSRRLGIEHQNCVRIFISDAKLFSASRIGTFSISTRAAAGRSLQASGTAHRQSSFSFGMPPAGGSSSSSSGAEINRKYLCQLLQTKRVRRTAATRHCKSRLVLGISCSIRSYVSSRVSGSSSSRTRRTLGARQWRRASVVTMPLWGQPRSVVVAFALGALCSLDLPLPLLSLARWGWTCCGSQNGRGLISCTVVRSAAIGYVYVCVRISLPGDEIG